MGQHSSPSEWHFYRSVMVWFLPWVVIAGVIGVAVWIGVDALSGGGETHPVVVGAKSPSAKPTPTPKKSSSPKPVESPSPSASPSPKASPSPSVTPDKSQPLITDGITVQVLNASGVAGADQAMSDRLTRLGFDVIAVQQAATAYPRTTVFWSFSESKPAAKALAARFGWIAQPKPENLSASVDMHVVVGADEG